MKSLLLPLLCLLYLSATLDAQTLFSREKRDYIWTLGYGNNSPNPIFGGSRISFHTSPPTVSLEPRNMNFEAAASCMSSTSGQLLYYSNGITIDIFLNQTMENGHGINPSPFTNEWAENGIPYPQTLLALPQIGDRYLLFHLPFIYHEEPFNGDILYSDRLYYSKIDMAFNNGNGIVLEKNISVILDTIDQGGKITAVRHANGRDWWVVVAQYNTNHFYRLLVTPDSVYNHGLQTIGQAVPSGLGQAAFSPDGTKYARLNLKWWGFDQYVDIFDFDRCSGEFSNPVQFTYRDSALMGGLAFSENSRFLYVSSFGYVYQNDLQSDSISTSKIVVGFPEELGEGYFLSQLAPNGEIYIGTQGTHSHMHVIQKPNKAGSACNFEYIGLDLPTLNFRTVPNFPYFGLGPQDGSSCDTLNINNPVPHAAFEYTKSDSTMTVDYFDASLFATEWLWDFGDGITSSLRHPVHSYSQSGLFEVCLTASNITGAETICKDIKIDAVTNTNSPDESLLTIKLFPNPAEELVYITIDSPSIISGFTVRLFDFFGRQVLRQPMEAIIRLDVVDFPDGLYLCTIENESGVYWATKLCIR